MSSSFSNPTEIFSVVACSSGEGSLTTGYLCINPALLCVPTGDLDSETTVARAAAQSPVGPQPQLATYDVSTARIFMFCTDVSQPHPHGVGLGLGGHVAIQHTHRQDRCRRPGPNHGSRNLNMNCKKRRTAFQCTDCKKGFKRSQELSRHRKDVHEPPRNCLFCVFKWSRPSNIKAHLLAKHSEKFTAEHLVTFQALCGRMIVAFLDAYN